MCSLIQVMDLWFDINHLITSFFYFDRKKASPNFCFPWIHHGSKKTTLRCVNILILPVLVCLFILLCLIRLHVFPVLVSNSSCTSPSHPSVHLSSSNAWIEGPALRKWIHLVLWLSREAHVCVFIVTTKCTSSRPLFYYLMVLQERTTLGINPLYFTFIQIIGSTVARFLT